jgi:hypothetical protein
MYGLEVDRRQVPRARDALLLEALDHALAVDRRVELDDVDEPRADVVLVVPERCLHSGDVRQQLGVPLRGLAAKREDRLQLLHLRDAERGAQVVEPVVEAQPRVLEPAAAVGAALVAQRAQQLVRLLRTSPPSAW